MGFCTILGSTKRQKVFGLPGRIAKFWEGDQERDPTPTCLVKFVMQISVTVLSTIRIVILFPVRGREVSLQLEISFRNVNSPLQKENLRPVPRVFPESADSHRLLAQNNSYNKEACLGVHILVTLT